MALVQRWSCFWYSGNAIVQQCCRCIFPKDPGWIWSGLSAAAGVVVLVVRGHASVVRVVFAEQY